MLEEFGSFLGREELFFKDEESLRKYLAIKGFSVGEISRTLVHENAHISKARECGYSFSGYKVRRLEDEICIIPMFDLAYYLNSNSEERRKIALAPEDPSENDYRVAKDFSKSQQSF